MKTINKNIVQILLLFFSIAVFSQTTKTAKLRYDIKNVSLNDKQSNFGTSYYINNQVIYTSPAKRNYLLNNIWKPNGQPYLDVYVADIDASTGDLINKKKIKTNSYYHDGVISYDARRSKVYFTRNNYDKGKHSDINRLQLFVADVTEKDKWTNVKKLPFNDSRYSYGHPALSEDGNTLYFVSDMPGGLGRTDIYKVAINPDGSYGTPKNLGKEVNTSGKEMFPYVDGNTDLYFSTDSREDGYGGLDVYMIRLAEDKNYPAINLGKGINSVQDDFAFIINSETRTGYFSSNRFEGKGDDDIYYFKELRAFKLKCTQNYTFVIKDKKTKSLIEDSYITIQDSEGQELVKTKTDKGVYKYELDCDNMYKIIGDSKYHKKGDKKIFVDKQNDQEVTEPLFLEARFVEKRGKLLVDINNIYFDYNKFDIRPDAAIELYKIVEVMRLYPELKIEAGSHTDSRGKRAYNKRLSYRRAKSVVDFIISKGISPLRIISKGYGESQPINGCVDGVRCFARQHALNRRTEFVILNPEVIDDKE